MTSGGEEKGLTARAHPLLEAEDCPHILVVDDDEKLRHLLSRFLRENGFLVSTAAQAAEAEAILARFDYDLMILDVMMPGEDGVSLTRRLAGEARSVPVLLLTALGGTEDRISGFEAGADDYLAKPFEPKELLLRIRAILRRVQQTARQKRARQDGGLRLGDWLIDLQKGEMTHVETERRLSLTQVEHTLLKALYSRRGVTVSRDDLAAMCGVDAAERTIDVQVTRLRRKIEPDIKSPRYVQTVRGKGYVLWADG